MASLALPDLRGPSRVAAGTLAAVVLAALLVPLLESRGESVLWALLGLAGVAVVWAHPQLGILAMVGVLAVTVVPETAGPRLLNLPYLVGGALLVPFVVRVVGERRIVAFESPQVRLLLAIGALAVLSTVWNDVRGLDVQSPGIDKTRWLLGAFVSRLGFLVLFVAFVDRWKHAAAVVAVIVLFTALGSIDAWRSFGSGVSAVARAAGEFGYSTNSNRLAFVCLFATSFVWFYRTSGRAGRWKPLLLPLIVLLPATALATGSRSGLLQAAVLGVFALGGGRGLSVRQRVGAVLLLGALGFALFVATPESTLERATTFDAGVDNPGQRSLQSRFYQIENALGVFARHPILGVGLGNYEAVTTPINDMGRGPHNSYLRALTEGGVGMLGLYLALFVVTWRSLGRAARFAPPEHAWLPQAVRGALLPFLVYSATADTWHADHLYLLVGFSIVAERLALAGVERFRLREAA
jgi:O-antigen ligase